MLIWSSPMPERTFCFVSTLYLYESVLSSAAYLLRSSLILSSSFFSFAETAIEKIGSGCLRRLKGTPVWTAESVSLVCVKLSFAAIPISPAVRDFTSSSFLPRQRYNLPIFSFLPSPRLNTSVSEERVPVITLM